MDVKFKVWVENKGEVVLSNGKFDILKTIEQLGSIHKGRGTIWDVLPPCMGDGAENRKAVRAEAAGNSNWRQGGGRGEVDSRREDLFGSV